MDDKILGGAGQQVSREAGQQVSRSAGKQGSIRPVIPFAGPDNGPLLEVNGAESDIQIHSVGCPDEKNPVAVGELPGIGASRGKTAKQEIYRAIILGKIRQHGRIRIAGHPGFSPSLNR